MSFFRTASPSPLATVSAPAPVLKPQYSGLQIQTSSSALPIPIVYGRTRIAPNIVWTGAFQSHPHYSQPAQPSASSSGGGKGGSSSPSVQPAQSSPRQITGYTYTTAFVMGLCEGPIADLLAAFHGQSVSSPGSLNTALIAGTTPQAPWSFLSSTYALGYPGTALVVSSQYQLGSSASIGNLSFEVAGRLYESGSPAGDADPAAAIFDYLTSVQYGVGFPAASIDATLYSVYQPYCQAHALAFSPAIADQETANATLTRWLQLTNATAVWSGGRLKIVPYDDGAAAVYDLTDDDFIADDGTDPVIVTRTDPYGASNIVMLEALDRANRYSPTTVTARDQGSIEQTGTRSASTITAHELCDLGVAATVAQLILQRGLYVRNTYAFKLSWEYGLLEPMDVVTLTDAGLGLAQTPVRITEVAEDQQGLLSVTAEEYPGQIGTTAGFVVDGATGNAFDREISPAAVNPPVIIEPPSDLTNGAAQLWVGLSGGTAGIADPNWGGAAIFASTDNATYDQIGATTGPANQGVLTAAIGGPPGMPGDTLAVSFAESGATILATSQPTLIAVDGEVMSFTSALLTGANAYRLGGLKRAIYGQRGGAHAAGAQALVLDTAVFAYALPTSVIGQTLWFKFASVNTFGRAMQDLSTCTAYQVMPVGSGLFGPITQAIATGTSLDEGLGSAAINEADDFGYVSDLYTDAIDMGLASEAATALAVQSGGTGATSAAMARGNIGAASAGANADITSLTNLTGVGIGTGVDTTTNKLAVKSASILFDNAGNGVQQIVNKAGASDSGALTFQTAYSTRALAGLLGSDRYRVSVSAAGASFAQAIDIDPATGHLGVAGYTADANNALGVSGTACLFAASTDSMRFTFSKVAAANDATLSFQTSYSARALLGTTGSDAFQLKVSPDGTSFYQVFVADQTNGNVAFKALLGTASYAVAALPAGFNGALAFASNGRKPTEGAGAGTGVVVAFSNGQWRRLSDDSIVAA